MTTYPTLDGLKIPVSHNEAGVAFVYWGALAEAVRRLGWEQMLISHFGTRQTTYFGPLAEDVEEIVEFLKGRSE